MKKRAKFKNKILNNIYLFLFFGKIKYEIDQERRNRAFLKRQKLKRNKAMNALLHELSKLPKRKKESISSTDTIDYNRREDKKNSDRNDDSGAQYYQTTFYD
mgnify:CR=1 FL=1